MGLRAVVLLFFMLQLGLAKVAEAQPQAEILFMSEQDGNRDIYSMNTDGGNIQRLTNHPSEDTDPAWSPDRMQIAFASNRDGEFAIYVMSTNGSNVRRISPDLGSFASSPSWSPDGRNIVYVSNSSGGNQIHIIASDGSNDQKITEGAFESLDPSWSPDGRRIVFASNQPGNFEVFSMSVSGGDIRQLTDDATVDSDSPAWSPDGQSIAFAANGNNGGEVYVMSFDGSGVRVLASSGDEFFASPTWSPDGRFLIYGVQGAGTSLRKISVDGFSVEQLTDGSSHVSAPAWAAPEPVAGMIVYETGDSGGSVRTEVCPNTPPSRMVVGGTGRVTPGLPNNLRETPNGRRVGQIPGGGTFSVLDGPECAGGYTWWQVEHNDRVGWTAEGEYDGNGIDYWLEPIQGSVNGAGDSTFPVDYPTRCEQSLPTRISINLPIMAIRQIRLRESPTATLGTALADGTDMITVGEPVCAHLNGDPSRAELLWWPVRVVEGSLNGEQGWIAESGDGVYNVSIDPTP